jgi:hypothetical protein
MTPRSSDEDRGSQQPVIGVPAPRAGGQPSDGDSVASWQARSRIVLTPVAAPSILGLFGFAGAMMLAQASGGRTVLPLGGLSTAANVPGHQTSAPISYPAGMPGATVGQ